MSKPIRVLHWGMLGGLGGIEIFIMNIYRNIDRSKVQFDFLTTHDGKIAFEDEIIEFGGEIHKVIYSKRESLIKHYISLEEFFKNNSHRYQVIHMHMNNINFIRPLKLAKKYGIPIRICHSHNAGNMHRNYRKVQMFQEYINRKVIGRYTTHLLACSNLAGNWMFHNNRFDILNNGIDTKKFLFNEEVRRKVRCELSIDNKKVIGTIGRLQYQKNPLFIIDIFNQMKKKDINTVLIMVGEGPLKEEVEERIKSYKLEDSVFLLGARNDIPELLQAFDLFLLPSRFEGLGIVLIEAQASGLPCLTSKDVVPEEARVTDLLTYVSLEELAQTWAVVALEVMKQTRYDRSKEVLKQRYDIRQTVAQLEKIYLK